MMGDSDLDKIKRHFGVYLSDTPAFDLSVNTLLSLGLPEGAVREIVSGIWRGGYDEGFADGYDQRNDGA